MRRILLNPNGIVFYTPTGAVATTAAASASTLSATSASGRGGGAFSGKDPSKVDRSAAYAARYVAKNVVAAGLADRCEVQVAYAIGVAHPVSVMVETFGTEKVGRAEIARLVDEHFDLRPGAFREYLKLHRPIYQKTAAYGHFGREDHDFTWEKTDKAQTLREALSFTKKKEEDPLMLYLVEFRKRYWLTRALQLVELPQLRVLPERVIDVHADGDQAARLVGGERPEVARRDRQLRRRRQAQRPPGGQAARRRRAGDQGRWRARRGRWC